MVSPERADREINKSNSIPDTFVNFALPQFLVICLLDDTFVNWGDTERDYLLHKAK